MRNTYYRPESDIQSYGSYIVFVLKPAIKTQLMVSPEQFWAAGITIGQQLNIDLNQ